MGRRVRRRMDGGSMIFRFEFGGKKEDDGVLVGWRVFWMGYRRLEIIFSDFFRKFFPLFFFCCFL